MDQVFSLIKSLSQSEKRYFVRFSKFQTPATTNSYLALFNRLVKIEVYKEKELKKEFGAVHFAQLKQQLYKKLLQSLRLYYTGNSSQNEIFMHIHNYKLLVSKGLQVFAEKELKRADKIARDSEMSYEAAIIFREKNMLVNGMSDVLELQNRIKENDAFFKKQINTISNEHQYEKLFLEIEVLNKQLESTRSKEEMGEIVQYINSPLLQNEESAISNQSKIYFHFSKGLAFYLKSDYEKCANHMKATTLLLEMNENILNRQEDLYVRSLANQCLSLIHLNRFEESEIHFLHLKKVQLIDPAILENRDYITYLLQLMYFNKKKEYAKAIELINVHEEFSKIIEKKMAQKNGITQEKVYSVFQKAIALSGSGMHKKASQIINEFINQKAKGMKEDAYIMARLFFLFIRFELNDESLIESELRSVQRYLKEKNKLFLFEKHMLQFISKMLISTSVQENKKNFTTLKNELEALKEVEYERNAFIYFDFSDWVSRFV